MEKEESVELVMSDSMIQLNRVELEHAISVAKMYPRNVLAIKSKVLMLATCDQETAKGCFYKKPVDNKGTLAEGPSIRLAEIIAASYTNIKYGSRIIDIGQKWVTVQGVAIDLESNLSYTSEVKRSIWSEKGNYRYSQSLIETTTKAACAFAVRDAIFKVVPMGIFNAELKDIKKKATGADSGEKLSARITKMFAAFKKLGVTEEQICKRLDIVNEEEITEEHLETMLGLYNAIDDKEATVEEVFNLAKVNQDSKNTEAAKGAIGDIHGKK